MWVGLLLILVVFPISVMLPIIWLPVVPLLTLRVRQVRRRDAAKFALDHACELRAYGSVRNP